MSEDRQAIHKNQYDYIMTGGGLAGLSLAYLLYQRASRPARMLIVDRVKKENNDRTWCFWSTRPTPFDHAIYHIWDQIEFVSDNFRRVYDIAPYRYYMVRGIDFYQAACEVLETAPGVDFLRGNVDAVQDSRDGAQALIDGKAYLGKWIFDSTFKPSSYAKGPPGYHYLKQHFKGWEIETPTDCFEPGVATLFDFRTPQKGCMRFFYVLPFNKRRALVEYTLFSADLLKGPEYDNAISEYLQNVRGITSYRVESVEAGVIPMTDRPFPRMLGARIMATGTKGGRVKASSGYAFLRILNDSAAIVRSLEETAQPFSVPASPWRYAWFDTIMLQVMYRQGHLMKAIFTALFKNNTIQNIFRFLDETASPLENLRLIASLPPRPFLKALFRVKLLRRI